MPTLKRALLYVPLAVLLLILMACGGSEPKNETPVVPAGPQPARIGGAPLSPEHIRIDPNQDTNCRIMMLQGWSTGLEGPPGKHYLWAVTKRSSFRFYISTPEKGGTLRFIAFPFRGDGKTEQAIELFVNGRSLGKRLMPLKDQLYTYQLPPDYLVLGENHFEASFEYAMKPVDLGISKDNRPLSALFKRIDFLPGK